MILWPEIYLSRVSKCHFLDLNGDDLNNNNSLFPAHCGRAIKNPSEKGHPRGAVTKQTQNLLSKVIFVNSVQDLPPWQPARACFHSFCFCFMEDWRIKDVATCSEAVRWKRAQHFAHSLSAQSSPRPCFTGIHVAAADSNRAKSFLLPEIRLCCIKI